MASEHASERGPAGAMSPEAALRRDAERAAAGLPALLVKAERLASTVILGAHGRRRAGIGETFWQYRPATPGDPLPSVDWRRSARSERTLYVRETEWEAAQTVWLWCDRSQAMTYSSGGDLPSKGERAAELTAALAVLLTKGGERLAVVGAKDGRPGTGQAHLSRAVHGLMREDPEDFGAPPAFAARRGGRAVFIGDFFGDEAALSRAVRETASQGVAGLMLQVVDPSEESFPFDGRVVFESMAKALRFETDRAGALRDDYASALAARRDRLREVARRAGWRFATHRTDESASPALLWLVQGLSETVASGG